MKRLSICARAFEKYYYSCSITCVEEEISKSKIKLATIPVRTKRYPHLRVSCFNRIKVLELIRELRMKNVTQIDFGQQITITT
jgi:hypothetical protein